MFVIEIASFGLSRNFHCDLITLTQIYKVQHFGNTDHRLNKEMCVLKLRNFTIRTIMTVQNIRSGTTQWDPQGTKYHDLLFIWNPITGCYPVVLITPASPEEFLFPEDFAILATILVAAATVLIFVCLSLLP